MRGNKQQEAPQPPPPKRLSKLQILGTSSAHHPPSSPDARSRRAAMASEKAPLISIDICSDEDLKDHLGPDGDVIVKYRQDGNEVTKEVVEGGLTEFVAPPPQGKRHSTGDASDCAGFASAMLGRQCGSGLSSGNTAGSSVSLFEPGTVAVTKKKSGSRTAITDF